VPHQYDPHYAATCAGDHGASSGNWCGSRSNRAGSLMRCSMSGKD